MPDYTLAGFPAAAREQGAMPDDQTPDSADPLLTTAQAAQRMGKTYRQFTAYASHHKAVMPREGDPPLYRLSVIDAALARSRRPVKGLSVAPHHDSPQGQTEQSESTPSAETSAHAVELARRVVDLSIRNDELHERLHAKDQDLHGKDAEIQSLLSEAGRREQEHRTELDRVRAEYEQRAQSEREKKAASWWGRLWGRG